MNAQNHIFFLWIQRLSVFNTGRPYSTKLPLKRSEAVFQGEISLAVRKMDRVKIRVRENIIMRGAFR